MRAWVVFSLTLGVVACGDNLRSRVIDATTEEGPVACSPTRGANVSMRLIGEVPGIAVLVTAPPEDPRLFVVVREGQIRIFDGEELRPDPFIDLAPSIYLEQTVERGLLGLAFHPSYATNRQFFVYYTTQTHNIVARCTASATDPNRADPTCVPILEILHDISGNHNGGMLEFGSDGHLYISSGDGGTIGDPERWAQDPSYLVGKILRIDVDARDFGLEYGIPPTNPYAMGGGRPEVFIRGLRNPWRFSFDRGTGDLWIGDVGESQTEEMTVLRPAQQSGANLGWPMYEGDGCCATQNDHCSQADPLPCDPAGMTFPQDTRRHLDNWYSMIAGQTYRGSCYPDLVGYHFYTDVIADVLVKARLRADDTLELVDLLDVVATQSTSLHADARGELYLTKTSGKIYRLEARP